MLFVSTEIYLNEDTSNVNINNTCILDLRYKIPEEKKDEIFERSKTETQEQIASDYNITRQRVAKVVGITQRRVGQIENGSNGNISITSMLTSLRLLRLPLSLLL